VKPLALELLDIQGLLRHGYPYFHDAAYCLFTIEDVQAFGGWLRALRKDWIDEAYARKATLEEEHFGAAIAFAANGLRKLGLKDDAMCTFPAEFQEGMVAEHRSRMLGDVGTSAPLAWEWGGDVKSKGNPKDEDLHGVVMVFSLDKSQVVDRANALKSVPQLLLDQRLRALQNIQGHPKFVREIRTHLAIDPKTKASLEPFGFADGLSQPYIEGLTLKKAPQGVRTIRAGEFVLGYLNEVNRLPGSPSVRGPCVLPPDPATGRGDLGRNGSFLVMRQLEQDVAAFNKLVDSNDLLAAQVVGRWRSGEPLVRYPTKKPEPKLDEKRLELDRRHKPREQTPKEFEAENDFGYHHEDRYGFSCPLGSHIRRANPRDALADGLGIEPIEAQALVDQHRILRRGRVYTTADGKKTGLVFICLNANIERQFEFVQSSWLLNPEFGGLSDERDPILGPGGHITLQKPVLGQCVEGLQQYVTVKGGAYFFLPGITALKYLELLANPSLPPSPAP